MSRLGALTALNAGYAVMRNGDVYAKVSGRALWKFHGDRDAPEIGYGELTSKGVREYLPPVTWGEMPILLAQFKRDLDRQRRRLTLALVANVATVAGAIAAYLALLK